MSRCPAADWLDRFASGRLGPADHATTADHVRDCPMCRAACGRVGLPETITLDGPPPAPTPSAPDGGQPAAADAPTAKLWRHELALRAGERPVHAGATFDIDFPAWPTAHRAPAAVPGYELLGELGRGGMGVVFKARQVKLNRLVALKMIHAGELTDPDSLARFRTEAEAVARLQHPNIVQIYEVGEAGGRPYFSLEYVDGGSLAQRAAGRPQPPRVAAAVVETLARAIHYAHAQGVVHRDLKPSNVLLQRAEEAGQTAETNPPGPSAVLRPLSSGSVKIADFGLAKYTHAAAAARADSPTRPGLIVGTPQYMAPERAAVTPETVGPAADVYSLGAILYELLTGRPPFQGANAMDTLLQVRLLEPIAPRVWQPKTPRDLETIVVKCLQKEPRHRYASARDLGEDLRRFQDGVPIRARPASLTERAWKAVRRHPAVAALSLTAALATVLGLAAVTWQWRQAEDGRASAERARDETAAALTLADDRLALAEQGLYLSRVAQAHEHVRSGHVARAADLLDLCRPHAPRPDRRGWEWHYLRRLCRADLLTIPDAHDTWAYAVAFGGRWVVSAGGGNPFYEHAGSVVPGQVIVWDPATGKKLTTLVGHSHLVTALVVSPDGRFVVTGSHDGTARVYPLSPDGMLADPSAVRTLDPRTAAVTAVAVRPDGREIATAGRGGVRVWDPTTGSLIRHFGSDLGDVHGLAYAPDGTRLAVAHDVTVLVFDPATGGQVAALAGHERAVRCVAFHTGVPGGAGSGRQIASGSDDGTVRVWDVAGRELRKLEGHDGRVWSVAFAPGGETLASGGADGTVRLWDLRQYGLPVVYQGHVQGARGVAFSPDGKTLVSGGHDGAVRLWDAHRDPRAWVLPGEPERVAAALAFRGRELLAVRLGGGSPLEAWDPSADAPAGRRDLAGFAPQFRLRGDTAISPDGRYVAGVSADKPTAVHVWDSVSGERVATVTARRRVMATTFSPDGRRLLTADFDHNEYVRSGKPAPNSLRAWDWRTETVGWEVPLDGWPTAAIAFSRDGRVVALGGGLLNRSTGQHQTSFQLRDGTTGRLLHDLAGSLENGVSDVAVSPDGRLAVTVHDWEAAASVWDVETGAKVERLPAPVRLSGVTFSPDGGRLAAVGLDPVLVLWDAATWQQVLTLRAPVESRPNDEAFRPRVAFSPDGRRLAATAWTGAVTVWDAGP